MLLPNPTMFSDWKVWASRLLSILQVEKGVKALPRYSKTALPSAATPGLLIYVPDEAGGAVPAFSDGTDWRRLTDRAVVS